MRNWITALLVITLFLSSTAAVAEQAPLRVYYAAPARSDGAAPPRSDGAGPEGGVLQALRLASDFTLVSDPAQANVFVLNGAIPDPAAIAARVRGGAGLVLILGPQLGPQDAQAVLGVPLELGYRDLPLSLVGARGVRDSLLSEIVWTGAPQVRERYCLSTPASDVIPLVVGFEDQSLVLGMRQIGQGRAYFLMPFLDQSNPQFQGWAYFNYLIYHLTMRAAGRTPLSFAAYPASPVPHARERTILYLGLAVMLALAAGAYALVRRYSLAHPEALDILVANRAVFASREAGTAWEEIGFHRPLGGFLVALMSGLLLFVPLIIYQNLILPVYLLPSAQALGIWGRVTQVFLLIWNLFDMGTSTAFIKYLSQYRVHDPRKGIMQRGSR